MEEEHEEKVKLTSIKEKYDLTLLQVIRKLYKYIKIKNRKNVYLLVFFIFLTVVFSWFTPLIFKILIDEGLGGNYGAPSGNLELIFILGILFFIFTVVGVLSRIVQGYIISKLATITMYNLRHELFVRFQELGLDYHEGKDKTAGKKISYLTNDVDTIQELIHSGLLMVIGNIFLIFGALILMFLLSWQLSLVSFIIAPSTFLVGSLLFKKARKYFKELRDRISTVTSSLDESIMGMRIIHSFAVEQENLSEFKNSTKLERETTIKAGKLMAFIPGLIIFVITIALGILFFTAGLLIREGLMTQGSLVAFIFYVFQFFEPLFSLISFFTLLQNSIAASARIIQILDQEASIKEEENAIELDGINGIIEYRDVDFFYEENNPILKKINIKIEEKERLALVGYTGAGKSTIIKLLSRFYDPSNGCIEIDGIDIRMVKIESLRQKMGIVLQENFLFSGTIMDNIRYGKLDASDQEVIQASKKVSAHDFIIELENGYDTEVGERGNKLSGGERQLIAFARALIADPPILILDEATSSIDPYSELLIQQALETLLKGRTSISIAHRLSTIINSDRIVVVDQGKIIEQGTHQDLIKQGGFYHHLYEMQFRDPFKT